VEDVDLNMQDFVQRVNSDLVGKVVNIASRCAGFITKNFNSEFKPELTPKQMLKIGVFGGRYLRDCKNEFPPDWYESAKLHKIGLSGHSEELNFFKVDASQPISVWQEKGWIHPQDPRGWFQWYCRYYRGRRTPIEDARQIKRWYLMKRHITQVRNHCRTGDYSCHTKQRQALLHWAYDSRKI
jgi:hypothetical protein